MKLQWKLTLIVAFATVMSIALVTYLIRAHLVASYRAEAKKDARQNALLIRHGLLGVMMETNDYAKIEQTIANLSRDQTFKLKIIRSAHVVKQHGVRRDETPDDDNERRVLASGETIELFEGDTYKIIYPFITDKRCGSCHLGLDDKPVPAGVVNGAASLTFDLSAVRENTNTLINHITLSLGAVMIFTGLLLLAIAHKTVIKPIKAIAQAITGFTEDRFDVNLPSYDTREIKIMADEVRQTAMKLSEVKTRRDEEIAAERARSQDMQQFVISRARDLGLSSDAGVSQIMTRLSRVVDENERMAQISAAFKFITQKESRMEIPNDISVIQSVAVYLAHVTTADPLKRRSIELALDEALANAMIHGNLEVPSHLKETDFESFNDMIAKRSVMEPYASRKLALHSYLNENLAVFTITDEGRGFDWRGIVEREADTEAVHGRGLLIIKALATSMSFNDKGNKITLTFDLEKKEPSFAAG